MDDAVVMPDTDTTVLSASAGTVVDLVNAAKQLPKESIVGEEDNVVGEIVEQFEDALVAGHNMLELAEGLKKLLVSGPAEPGEKADKAYKKLVRTQKQLLRAKMIEWDIAYKGLKEGMRQIK